MQTTENETFPTIYSIQNSFRIAYCKFALCFILGDILKKYKCARGSTVITITLIYINIMC